MRIAISPRFRTSTLRMGVAALEESRFAASGTSRFAAFGTLGFAAFGTLAFTALGLEVERFAGVGMSELRIPV
jgi:hypothetical protein